VDKLYTLKENRLAGHGAIVLCALLWSTSGLFIRLLDWHPIVIAGSRSFFAARFFLGITFFSHNRKNAIACSFGQGPKLPRSFCIRKNSILSYKGLWYAATMLLFVTANKHTASANAILLQYAAPVWAALLGWFLLKERPRWEQWCALAFVGLGMFLVFSGGLAANSLLGDTLALVSGITFAVNSVVLRAHALGAQNKSGPEDIILFSYLICTVFSIPFFFLHPPLITAANILCIVFMGFFQLGLASAFFAYGIKRVPAVQALLTSTIEPVLNPVWVLLAIGETPGLSVITGGAIIIASIVFSSVMLTALRRHN
jgi:drug/metabolite transporter (DMT)-like permease